jgi:hypothetical protein
MNKKLLALLFAVPGFCAAQTTYKVLGFAPSLDQVAVESKDVTGHDFSIVNAREQGWYVSAKTDKLGVSRGNQTKFRLVKTDKDNVFKLFCVNNNKFVAFTDTKEGQAKTKFVDNETETNTNWHVVPNMGDKGRENKFDILPGTVDAKNPNSQSWNVYGGMKNGAGVIGHYRANDDGSAWCFEGVVTQQLKFHNSYSESNESYFMTIRGFYVHKADNNFTADNNLTFNDKNYLFQLVGTPENFKIYNVATGKPIGTNPSARDDNNRYLADKESLFSAQSAGGRVYVKETRKPNLYLNFRDGFLSTWNSAEAWNGRDEGSRILFTTEDGILAEAAKKLAEEIKSTYTDDKFGGGLNQYPKSAKRAVTQTLDSLQAAQDLTNSDITKKKEKYTNAKLFLDFLRLNMPQDGDLLYLSFQRDANVKYLTSALHEASENGWGQYGSLGGHLTGKAEKGNDALFCLKLDAQGKATLVSVATGRRVAWEKRTDGKYYPTLASKDGEGAAFTISTRNGKYAFEADGRYLASDANGNYAEAYSDYHPQFAGLRLERVGTTLPVHIGESGFASFWCPSEYTVPTGVTAFGLQIVDGRVKLIPVEGNVPKNTGIILQGTANTDVNLTLVPNGTTPAITGNLLQGSAEPKAITTLTTPVYALKKTGGLVKVKDYMPAFKAYFTASESQVRELLDRGLTGVVSVATEAEDAPIYDLSGRRVQQTTKGGVYVTNGKKFIAK